MLTHTHERALTRRKLMLRDAFAFLTLLTVTTVLFGLTLLLFRSFMGRRDVLARRSADEGSESLREGHPERAIEALRNALNYAPDNRGYEMMLAQALGEAKRTDESYAYFQALWDGQPGSGFINLELARLAAKRGDRSAAVEFYRASVYGTWGGDGVARRAEVRLELGRYLISLGQFDQARTELLAAAGNSPETAQLDRTVADLLSEAQDQTDAWSYYQKAVAAAPRDSGVLDAAGGFAYNGGYFASAHRLLARAAAARPRSDVTPEAEFATALENAARLEKMVPEPSLSAEENAARVLAVRRIAKKRLVACAAQHTLAGAPDATLEELNARWAGPDGASDAFELRDAAVEDSAMDLVYATELAATKLCGGLSGDDALLLFAAKHHRRAATVAESSAASQQGPLNP